LIFSKEKKKKKEAPQALKVAKIIFFGNTRFHQKKLRKISNF